ncbi:outer membrane protein assembly factor BamB [Herbaspirillum autotrophicum]|uniref:outer membrane protein assembly factor BamB n=1 Tax=Herbaspirillum autotrophicum TaxID=180195 RepID=UPI00067CA4A1|nr:outer membrane protein assembly factor BamB [Herbaspirillum autotrophicum]
MRSESQVRSGRAAKLAATLVSCGAIAVLSGCSLFSSKKDPNPPAPLVEFKQSLRTQTLWTVSIGKAGTFLFSPAVAKGSVFAAAADGNVTRIDVVTGQTVWRVSAGTSLTAGVGSDGNTVAVVGEKGQVQAFDANGKSLWKAQAPSEVLSAPAVGQGLVVVRSIDNRISAFDAETGARRWSVQRPLPTLTLRTAPGIVLDSQTAFVALPGGRLSALALNNGGPRWEIAVGDPRGTTELERIADVSGMPAVGVRDVCAVAYQGRIGCFDLGNGNVRWVKDFSSNVGVTLSDSYLFAADDKGGVTQFARDTGAALWRNSKLANRQLSAPIGIGRSVAVGDYQGYIHFLSREDGAFVARTSTDGSPIQATPVAAGQAVIFQTQAGSLVALTTE